jgi:hypothetical protein
MLSLLPFIQDTEQNKPNTNSAVIQCLYTNLDMGLKIEGGSRKQKKRKENQLIKEIKI